MKKTGYISKEDFKLIKENSTELKNYPVHLFLKKGSKDDRCNESYTPIKVKLEFIEANNE